MMLWMDRLKVSLCVIKIPMGPEWMFLWPLTKYGRATIARQHLLQVVSKHVADRSELVTHVHRGTGHHIQDAAALPFPLVRLCGVDVCDFCLFLPSRYLFFRCRCTLESMGGEYLLSQ
jgi:hypothetical protein